MPDHNGNSGKDDDRPLDSTDGDRDGGNPEEHGETESAAQKAPDHGSPEADEPSAGPDGGMLDEEDDVLVIDTDATDGNLDEVETLINEALEEQAEAASRKDAGKHQARIQSLIREKAHLGRQIESFSSELYNLRTEMKRMEDEKAELVDQVKRTQAELINFRKRVERDKEDTVKFASAELMEAIVPVIDNFERALSSAGPDVPASYREGIDLIYQSLMATLKKQGLAVIEAKGKQFDPTVHEAMMREPTSEYRNNEVIEELQKGYIIHDRLLRPAMVRVAYNAEEEARESERFFEKGADGQEAGHEDRTPDQDAPSEGGGDDGGREEPQAGESAAPTRTAEENGGEEPVDVDPREG